jgi:hypothetical protein
VKVKKELREQIKQQRGAVCDECREPGTRFCFQRKKNVRKYPDLANDEANIWMRCEPCQRRWESERAAKRRPSAKVNDKFRKRVRAERGNCCEVCGTPGPTQDELATMTPGERSRRTLHLHHKSKQRTHPEIRCERKNLVLCCQPCHVRLEAELNIELREQSAEGGNTKTVEHSVSEATSNTSSTADPKSAARVPGGEVLSPPKLHEKCSGAERPKERPDTAAPGKPDPIPQASARNSVYTPPAPSLGLKLRQQAAQQGLAPGSPRWRAYVLGTQAAARKRQREAKSQEAKQERNRPCNTR